MNLRRPAALVVGLALTLGVALAQEPAAPPPEMLPPPFTAAQIRDATKAGRRYRFQITVQGAPNTIHVMEFVSVTPDGATMRRSELDADGKELSPPTTGEVTWAELESHAAFPKALTTVKEADVTVPAGTFHCKVYEVTEGATVARFSFAVDLPGAPVLMEVVERDPATKADVMMQRMVLLEHRAGA